MAIGGQSAVFSGVPIAEGLFEKRCRAVWFVNIEAGRVVPFVKFQVGRAIKQGTIHLQSLIPKVGLEPTRSCEDRILSPARLPFRSRGADTGLTQISGIFARSTIALGTDLIVVALGSHGQ